MRNIIELLAFHDERRIKGWLYHGFVLCEAGQFSLLTNELLKVKTESNCKLDKRIHFSELTSKSTGSSKTRTASRWVELFLKDLYKRMWVPLLLKQLQSGPGKRGCICTAHGTNHLMNRQT